MRQLTCLAGTEFFACRFNGDLSMKSYVFIDEGIFFGKKEHASQMKTLITEKNFRVEEKYQKAEHLPSFHNFIVASNTDKAVEINSGDERRFMPMRSTDLQYTQEHKSKLWALVTDDGSRELFYQYSINIDTRGFTIGQAPRTAFKNVMQTQQAPPAIKWLKHAIDSAPDIMGYVPTDAKDEDERVRIAQSIQDKKLFYLKSRDENMAFLNLVGEQFYEKVLALDLKKMSHHKTIVPARHVADCVQQFFKGQAYRNTNVEDTLAQLAGVGLSVDIVCKVVGRSKRCVVFPSIQSIHYLLFKGKWVTSPSMQSRDEEEEEA